LNTAVVMVKKSLFVSILILLFTSVYPRAVGAEGFVGLMSKAAILVEETTGKILLAKFEDETMYPASMTKILTVMLLFDYLEPDETITVGSEISLVPAGSSMAGNVAGEVITAENLARLILIASGNESSNVAALAVVRKATGREVLPVEEALGIFGGLMNERAKKLGAASSNFVNSHGYHDPDHYTTARDMAVICREALKNELFRKIAAETSFVGNGAGADRDPNLNSSEYDIVSHNLLILPESEYYYPYANGIKTGLTDEAGECLAASAERDGVSLIAVVFDSPPDLRWVDTVNMFEYGFNTYKFETIQTKAALLGSVALSNIPDEAEPSLTITAADDFSYFLSKAEYARVVREIEYDETLLAHDDETDAALDPPVLTAPIPAGAKVGKVSYTLDGEKIFEGYALASREADARPPEADKFNLVSFITANALTPAAIPYWISGVLLVTLAVIFTGMAAGRKQRRRGRYY